MKSKIVLLICSLLLAAALAGCGAKPSPGPSEEVQKTAEEEASQEDASKEEVSQEFAPKEEILQEDAPEEDAADKTAEELKQEALAAYRKILEAAPAATGEHPELFDASFDYDQNIKLLGKHYDLFALWDIDGNEIPELIALSTVNFRWTPVSVYTFADGEAVLLKDPSDPGAHGTFEQKSTANGAYVTNFCEENHIHSVWRGSGPAGEAAEENRAYALNGAALTETACSASEGDTAICFHDIAKTNTPDNLNAEPEDFTPSALPFAGNWYEPAAQRGYCTATSGGGVYDFLVSWNDGGCAFIWSFSGTPDKDGAINYTDCIKELHSWNEKNEETVETLAENACGRVWLTDDGRMLWLENLSDPQPTEFVRE